MLPINDTTERKIASFRLLSCVPSVKVSNFPSLLLWICMKWFFKSNLNLFQRLQKRHEKFAFEGFPWYLGVKDFRREGNYMQKREGGKRKFIEPRKPGMFHDRNSCSIVVLVSLDSPLWLFALSSVACNYCSKGFLIDCILILKYSRPSDVTHLSILKEKFYFLLVQKVFFLLLLSVPSIFLASGIIINLHSLF